MLLHLFSFWKKKISDIFLPLLNLLVAVSKTNFVSLFFSLEHGPPALSLPLFGQFMTSPACPIGQPAALLWQSKGRQAAGCIRFQRQRVTALAFFGPVSRVQPGQLGQLGLGWAGVARFPGIYRHRINFARYRDADLWPAPPRFWPHTQSQAGFAALPSVGSGFEYHRSPLGKPLGRVNPLRQLFGITA